MFIKLFFLNNFRKKYKPKIVKKIATILSLVALLAIICHGLKANSVDIIKAKSFLSLPNISNTKKKITMVVNAPTNAKGNLTPKILLPKTAIEGIVRYINPAGRKSPKES